MESVSILCGLVVRIPGSHPGGPGSIPSSGTYLFCHQRNIFQCFEQFQDVLITLGRFTCFRYQVALISKVYGKIPVERFGVLLEPISQI